MAAFPLKIIFAGTPLFAEQALSALLSSEHQVVAVYTQPDRPAGRGLKLTKSPVKLLAEMYNIPVFQPASLKNEEEPIKKWHADVMVVAAYGLLIPSAILNLTRLGCVNIHPSLLPRWRGAAPIQRTLAAGDDETGVTIMQMDQGLDTGPILLTRRYTIAPNDTSQTLHDKLAVIGAEALLETLQLLSENKITPLPQDNQLATYANKITKEEALIDWEMPAQEIENRIRAFNPWPVAYTTWKNETLRVWLAKALPENNDASPRTILHASEEGIDIATGHGALRLLQLQLPGGKAMPVADFYRARQQLFVIGEHLV